MSKTEEFNKIMQRVNSSHAANKKKSAEPVKSIQAIQNMNALQESLSKCKIQGNKVLLPEEHLDNYQEVRKALLNAGGTYQRNSFVFPDKAEKYIVRFMSGETVNTKKEFQMFFTPSDVAEWMVREAHIQPNDIGGEFSAGNGALIKAARLEGHNNLFKVCELNEHNRNELLELENVELIGKDFLKVEPIEICDFILLNPPFSKNQDIDHVTHAMKFLKKGGRLVSVMSKHWQVSNNKKEKAFREWAELEGAIFPLDSGRFKQSGTMVSTCILVIDK